MQVLNYQTPPILQEAAKIPIDINNLDSIKQQIHQPIIEVLNNTLGTVNETIQHVIGKVQDENTLKFLPQTHFQDEWNLLYLLRIIFYIFVVLKVIELVFAKRRKMDIQERVYRKYLFSHGELIRQFNEDERKVMDTTLKNTIKNANIEKVRPNARKNSNKRVIFHQKLNQYFEPKKYIDSNDELSPLQAFLSKPVKIKPHVEEQQQVPEQREFQIIETIDQNRIADDQSGIFFQDPKVQTHSPKITQDSTTKQNRNQDNSENIEAKV